MPLFRALCLLTLSVTPALADMSFFMTNRQPNAVVVELHARESGTVWPGGDRVYLLDPSERKTVTIACRQGETICYGAWVHGDDSVAFGIGPDRDLECANCCSICVDQTTMTIRFGD